MKVIQWLLNLFKKRKGYWTYNEERGEWVSPLILK